MHLVGFQDILSSSSLPPNIFTKLPPKQLKKSAVWGELFPIEPPNPTRQANLSWDGVAETTE